MSCLSSSRDLAGAGGLLGTKTGRGAKGSSVASCIRSKTAALSLVGIGGRAPMSPRTAITRHAPCCSGGAVPLEAEFSAAGPEAAPATAEVQLSVFYHRGGGAAGWGLHAWGDAVQPTDWHQPLMPETRQVQGQAPNTDGTWVKWALPATARRDDNTGEWKMEVHLLPHLGDEKDCTWTVAWSETWGAPGEVRQQSVWLVQGQASVFLEEPNLDAIPKGSLGTARSMWMSRNCIAVDWGELLDEVGREHDEAVQLFLHASANALLRLTAAGVEGADVSIALQLDPGGLPKSVRERFPHVASFASLVLPQGAAVEELVACQLAVSCVAGGRVVDATEVQITGILDDCFFYEGPLGPTVHETKPLDAPDSISLTLWAPTAQSVSLLLFSEPHLSPPQHRLPLERGSKGQWTAQGIAEEWLGLYYQFEIVVYHPQTRRLEKSTATDPYSRGLSANGGRSYVLDLRSTEGCRFLESQGVPLQPPGWHQLHEEKPVLESFADISLYELHIRDFSASDATVDKGLRGTYMAFTLQDSNGVRHLRSLSASGLTHVHLLPSFDFASVNEDRSTWQYVDEEVLKKLPPDSEGQQEAVAAIQDLDGFNWGYDPVHWGVPDGSYATIPDGPQRTLEHRAMVQGLNRLGLRVVLDVVYNHLDSSGPLSRHSVLDKVVPGYYLRRNVFGEVEGSACCNNTASEHLMVERLIVDDLVHWATQYKVDGFRFDLMGHLMKRTLEKARAALDELTVPNSGVDGSKIYMYGEGWDFGEVKDNARGINGAQSNLANTGIGSFNDRVRDAALGGSPFGDPQQQGFLTGLYLQPNSWETERVRSGEQERLPEATAAGNGRPDGRSEWREQLLRQTDWAQLALAGNLSDFSFTSHVSGTQLKGTDVRTIDGTPVAYASSPSETINYVSAHDNETLFDIVNIKTSENASGKDRMQICRLALALLALSQGIPFFHAGDEMLRSKSLDRDSYNSGDWFNRLDFSFSSNNFGVGLPMRSKNGEKWNLMRPLLQDATLKPTSEDISNSVEHLKLFLRIRYSSPLFRLPTANDVFGRLSFLTPSKEPELDSPPGIIAMHLKDGDSENTLEILDKHFKSLLVLVSVRPDDTAVTLPQLQGKVLKLHPELDGIEGLPLSCASDNNSFVVPSRSVTVLVGQRGNV